MDNKIRYLNTDLDLATKDDLTELANAFATSGASVLSVARYDDGLWHATIETDTQEVEPQASMAMLIGIAESLSEPLRNCWMRCTLREFNIGYDCGDEPWGFNQGLSNALLGRLAAAGASLRITIYPVRPEAPPPAQQATA